MQAATEIELHLCYPNPRARDVDRKAVQVLADSISEVGLMQPITVRKVQKSRNGIFCDAYEVIAGMHRVKAFFWLQRTHIPAFIIEADDLHAELMLIDENLRRNDLTTAERAAQQARRKRIWQELHPETRSGASGKYRPKSQLAQVEQAENSNEINEPADRYDEAAAKATGKSSATVRRDVHRGEKLGEDALAKVVRTSLDKGEELDALAKLAKAAPDKCAALIDRAAAGENVSAKLVVKQERRASREAELSAKIVAMPAGKNGVIVCDDEWDHQVWSRVTGMDRHAANHYETAADAHTVEELHERTKARFECAAPDCLLAMWATVQHLDIAIDLLRRRGFRYVSHYAWGKDKAGLGYWNRNKHEILLLGVRGNIPCPAPGTQWDSLILAPRGEHSAKPECFLEMFEAYFPNTPKIELNRRGAPRPGWAAWGNEAENGAASSIGEPVIAKALIRRDEAEPASDPGLPAGSLMDNDDLDIPNFLQRDGDNRASFMLAPGAVPSPDPLPAREREDSPRRGEGEHSSGAQIGACGGPLAAASLGEAAQ